MAEEGLPDKLVPDVAVHVKQRFVFEFIHVDKIASIHVHQLLLNIYGDQPVDVSTVRWWVVRFSRRDSNSGSPLLVQIVVIAACSSCSSLVKSIANSGDYVGKKYFIAENFLYQTVLLCSLCML